MTGRIHSIQSLGTVDGPGVRFVIFMQGCNLRCSCCHNPDTWDLSQGGEISANEIIEKVIRYKGYFGQKGGITISGGEPVLQARFCKEVFSLCHQNGINTCLDTSGSLLNEDIKELLKETDRVLLDIKYTEDELYKKHVGCSLNRPLEFLEYLEAMKIPTTLRQVIIPSLNDDIKSATALKEIANRFTCVDKIELLPFRKICQVKYDSLSIDFPFKDIPEPTSETMKTLEELLK